MSQLKEFKVKVRRIQIISLGGKNPACIEIVQKYLNCSRTYKPLSTMVWEAEIGGFYLKLIDF